MDHCSRGHCSMDDCDVFHGKVFQLPFSLSTLRNSSRSTRALRRTLAQCLQRHDDTT